MNIKIVVQKPHRIIEFQLFKKDSIVLVGIYEINQQKTLIYQQKFTFAQMTTLQPLFCQSWDIFSENIQHICQNSPDDVQIVDDSTVLVNFKVSLLERKIQCNFSLKLKRKLEYDDEMKILRVKVSSFEEEMCSLKKQVTNLRTENTQLLARVTKIEKMMSMSKSENMPLQRQEEKPKKMEQPSPKHKIEQKTLKNEQIQTLKQVKEEHIKLALNIDPNCLYYNKFKFQKNKVISLHEDYYQLYWKNPLPQKGSANIKFKMTNKNHCSIGILAESELKNQYSFQNKNSICFYTYFDGFFRGMYVRGEYIPLEWGMEVNEEVEVFIDMSKGTLMVSLNHRNDGKEVDISSLQSNNIYFFIEMYEKENSLELVNL